MERYEFELRQVLTYAGYLITKMTEQDIGKPYQDYNHEPIFKGSKWRVFTNIKIPMSNIPFDPEDCATYKRLLFQPYSGNHQILSEAEIEAMRPIDK